MDKEKLIRYAKLTAYQTGCVVFGVLVTTVSWLHLGLEAAETWFELKLKYMKEAS